ncbi:MAG TPA: histidine kinase dimerization/phospho-acceptor domain-containing protein [Sphingobium sp.]
MRFNDLIPTVLSGRGEGQWAAAILWRQCIDLLAQFDRQDGPDTADLDPVATAMAGVSAKVETDQKLNALREMGRRLTSPRLVRLLLADDAPVQVVAMSNARLVDEAWPAIIAEAGPLARSVLRQRTDLGTAARRALDAFGLSDLSLIDLTAGADMRRQAAMEPGAETGVGMGAEVVPLLLTEPAPTVVEDQSQIRRIVDRIERFTSERQERGHVDGAAAPVWPKAADPKADDAQSGDKDSEIAHVTFLTDGDGVIRTVHGAPVAALAGYRLATPSLDRSTGPDGQILGAFRRRGAFREGRLTIGEGLLTGCWLVDGDPLFDQRSGRFTGYRGIARRAGRHEIAPFMGTTPTPSAPDGAGQGEATSTATSMRQLIHELRSPLSGVMGFAELIEHQFLGPVNDRYRTMAGSIVADVRNLVDILDDLDLANREDRFAAAPDVQGTDAAHMLVAAVERLGPDNAGRQRIRLDRQGGLPPVAVAPTIAERMILHFVRALTGCVGEETLAARCHREGDRLLVEIDRPLAMADLSEAQLFDSGFEHVATNMDAPVLGVGFALRLVRRLAQANKGAFTVNPGHFALILPVPATPVEQGLSS